MRHELSHPFLRGQASRESVGYHEHFVEPGINIRLKSPTPYLLLSFTNSQAQRRTQFFLQFKGMIILGDRAKQ